MNSLGKRLFLTFMLILVVFSVISRIEWMHEYTRAETGLWDQSLKDVASQIVMSTPRRLTQTAASPDGPENYRLGADPPYLFKGDELSFQIWDLHRNVLLMRSPGSPPSALRPDFGLGFSDIHLSEENWRVYSISDAEGLIQVQVAKSQTQLRAEFRDLLKRSMRMTLLFVVVMTGAVWFVLRRTLRPLNTLRQDILARPALDLTPLPHANLPEELQPFIDAINRLLARLDEAVQNEKRFVADAAHELRTPLAVLASHAEVARQADSPAATREALDKLQQGIARSARLAEQLLDQARLDALHDAQLTETVALDRVIHVMAREFESEARAKQLQLKLDVAPCRIRGDVDALGVLVGNLLDNAIRHGHVGGRIEVRCHPAPLGGVTLSVADNGPGVPTDEHEKIFDRFYRVPGNRERGSGIGLSLVARVAALHGATRLCGSGLDGRGFQVTITFPALAGPQPTLET